MEGDPRKKLFGYLSRKGLADNEDQFNADMDTEAGRRSLYETMSGKGLYKGRWEDFDWNLKGNLEAAAEKERKDAAAVAGAPVKDDGNDAQPRMAENRGGVPAAKQQGTGAGNGQAGGGNAQPEAAEVDSEPLVDGMPAWDHKPLDSSVLSNRGYDNRQEVKELFDREMKGAVDEFISGREAAGSRAADKTILENRAGNMGIAMHNMLASSAAKERETDPQRVIDGINRMFGLHDSLRSDEEKKKWLRDNGVQVIKKGNAIYYKYPNSEEPVLVDAGDGLGTRFMQKVSDMAYRHAGLDMNQPEDGKEGEKVAAPLSEEELQKLQERYGKAFGDIVQGLEEELKGYLRQKEAPEGAFDYIVGGAFRDSMIKQMWDAVVKRASGSSGLRKQLRAEADRQYEEGLGWFGGMMAGGARGALTMGLFDAPMFAVAGAGSSVVGRGVGRLAARGGRFFGYGGKAWAMRYVPNVISSGLTFGNYDLMGSAVQQYANGKFDASELAKAWGKGLATGSILGTMNSVEKGVLRRFDKMNTAQKYAVKAGAFTTEVGFFTAQELGGVLEQKRVELAGKYMQEGMKEKDAEARAADELGWFNGGLTWAELGRAAGKQTALIGMLKGKGAAEQAVMQRIAGMKSAGFKLSPEAIEELKGYDVNMMLGGKVIDPKVLKKVAEGGVPEAPEMIDPTAEQRAEAWQAMMQDPNISIETKQVVTYLMTGAVVEGSPVMDVEASWQGDEATIVRKDAYGNVISRRKKRGVEAQKEMAAANWEKSRNRAYAAEENLGNVGSQMGEAIMQVSMAEHMSYGRVVNLMNRAAAGEELAGWEQKLVDGVVEAANRLTIEKGITSVADIRKRILDETGVDIDEAMSAKTPTEEQAAAVAQYNDMLGEATNNIVGRNEQVSAEVAATDEAMKAVDAEAVKLMPYVENGKVYKLVFEDGREYYVSKFHPEDPSLPIFYYDENGNVQPLESDRGVKIVDIDYEQYLSEYQNDMVGASLAQAQHKANGHRDDVPVTFVVNQSLDLEDGKQFVVGGLDGEEVVINEVQDGKEGSVVVGSRRMKVEELKSMMDRRKELQEQANRESAEKGRMVSAEEVEKENEAAKIEAEKKAEEERKAQEEAARKAEEEARKRAEEEAKKEPAAEQQGTEAGDAQPKMAENRGGEPVGIRKGQEYVGRKNGRELRIVVEDVDGDMSRVAMYEGDAAEPFYRSDVRTEEVEQIVRGAKMVKDGEPAAEQQGTGAGEPRTAGAGQPEAAAGGAYDRIPEVVDEKTGEKRKNYRAVPVETTYKALKEKYGDAGEEMVKVVAEQMVAEADKKMKAAGGDADKIAEAWREKRYWEGVRDYDAEQVRMQGVEQAKVDAKQKIDAAIKSVMDNYDRTPMTFDNVEEMIGEDIAMIEDPDVRKAMEDYWSSESDNILDEINRKYWEKAIADKAEELGSVKAALDSMSADEVEEMLLDLGVDQNFGLGMNGSASGFKASRIYKKMVEGDSNKIGKVIDEVAEENKRKREEWFAKQAAMRSQGDDGIRWRDGDEEEMNEYAGMSVEDSGAFVERMQAEAEDADNTALTREMWDEEVKGKFYETPIGKVKFGRNQFEKFSTKGRLGQFGMAVQTLTRPDAIVEGYFPEDGAERDTKYIFVKTFVQNGKKKVNFMSVSVKKDGNEVSISSHMIRDNRLKNLLQDHKMLWNRYGLDSSKNSTLAQGGSYVHTSYDPAISNSPRETLTTPSSSHKVDGVTLPSSELSNGKGTDNSANDQIITGNSAVDDEKYMQAVQNGDVETAQKMVLAKADAELGEDMRLESDEGVVGFKYHRGAAPKRTRVMYAVLNVTPEGFKAAYAGNKTGTPVGVWLDAQPLKSYASDKKKNDDGSASRYVAGDTGASWTEMFTPETYERMMQEDPSITKGTRWLYERGGKHGTDVPNFSQMNTRQNEAGEKVRSGKEGALPHNKLIFEIECGMDEDGDLTSWVAENGRFVKKKNQGMAWVGTNKFYFFKTNPNAVGNWGIAGTFRIKRLVPHDEIVRECERAGVPVQKWVGGYHPEDSGLSVEMVDKMYEEGKKRKLLDAVTYDDNGNVIPLSQRFSEKEDLRFRGEGEQPEAAVSQTGGGFYSPAEKAVMGVRQEKATGEQWLKMIEKAGGLKKEEDKWMGLSEWLRAQPKSVAKEDVLRFIRENSVKVEEVRYEEDPKEKSAEKTLFQYTTELSNEVIALHKEKGMSYEEAWAEVKKRFGDKVDDYLEQNDMGLIRPAKYIDENEALDFLNVAYNKNAAKEIDSTRLDYTTEGLENKKEVALVVPSVDPYNENDNIHFGDAGNGRAVAWCRFGETTDADGKRVLVIDEIQSKRHQDGREKGYKPDMRVYNELKRAYDERFEQLAQKYKTHNLGAVVSAQEREELQELWAKVREEQDKVITTDAYDKVPDAPFQKNWHEVVMKRMLRYAAENGYDRVAWTKGEQQAERYDLGNVLDEVSAEEWTTDEEAGDGRKYGEDSKSVYLGLKDRDIEFEINREGVIMGCEDATFNGKKLSEVIGKEAASEVVDSEGRVSFAANNIRIGGEGMKGFYDEMLPRFMNKYGKKWGVKVGEVDLPKVEEAGRRMWSVDVTEEMKESVMGGQPMWRENAQPEAAEGKEPAAKQQGTGADIEKVVEETAKKVNVKVNVVRAGDEKGLSEKVQKGLRRGGKGWYDPKTGEVYIYTPNAVSAADAVKTILHEVVGHKGLRELIGKERYDDVMIDLYAQLPDDVKVEIGKMAEKKYKGDIAYAMDEYFAGKAEEGVTPSWWGKVVGAVRSIAKNVFGMDIELSDGDVKYLLWRSYKGLRNESDWFDLAEDIAMRSKNKVGEYAEKAQSKMTEYRERAEEIFAGEGDKSLVGVHNLTEEKLMKVLKNGGLANPSTAVIDVDKTDYSAYGNISLVMPSRMVDRKSGRNAGTWTADAWTPTYPPVEKVMSQQGWDAYFDDMRKVFDAGRDDMDLKARTRTLFESWLEKGGVADDLAYWYMKERGMNPEKVRHDSGITKERMEEFDAITDGGKKDIYDLSKDELQKYLEFFANEKGEDLQSILDHWQEVKAKNEEMLANGEVKGWKARAKREMIESIDRYGVPYRVLSEVSSAFKRAKELDGSVDYRATLNAATDKMQAEHKEDFEKWLEEKQEQYGVREQIFTGYTPSGNRKYIDNTLENASRLMTAEGRNNSSNEGTIGSMMAAVVGKADSIDEIRAHRGKLGASEEETQAFKEKWSDVMWDVAQSCYKGDSWAGLARLNEALGKKDPFAHLKKEYGVTLSMGEQRAVKEFIKAVREEFPAGYFETKFERPVMLNEFAGAVVPKSASEKIKNALKEAGLAVFEYDPAIEGDRRRAQLEASDMEGVRFMGEGDKSLVGVHNITGDGLLHAAKMGGLANPSTAVIDMNKGILDNFGEISLVMPNSLVDKGTGKNVGTWSADAYTPRYPRGSVVVDLPQSAYTKLRKVLEGTGGSEYSIGSSIRADGVTGLRQSSAVKAAFAKEKGFVPDAKYKTIYPDAVIDEWAKVKGDAWDVLDLTPEQIDFIEEVFMDKQRENFVMKGVKGADLEKYMDLSRRLFFTEEGGHLKFNLLRNTFYELNGDVKNRGGVDKNEAERQIDDYARQNVDEYEKWTQNIYDDLGGVEKIFDGYTSSGKRRYRDNTLENISKMMKREGRAGGESFFGTSAGALRAKVSPVFKTLEQMRKNKGRIVDHEEFEKAKEQINEEFYELRDLLEGDMSGDEGYYRLVEAMKKGAKWVNEKYDDLELDDEDIARVDAFRDLLKTAPTEYFETKFERPVRLNEFVGAVVPRTATAEVRQVLKDAGLQIFEYNPDVKGDRERATNEASDMEGVRFRFDGETGAFSKDWEDELRGKEGMRMKNKEVAEKMEKKMLRTGKRGRELTHDEKLKIKQATGWERGADGMWRHEEAGVDVDWDSFDDLKVKRMSSVVVPLKLADLIGKDNELFESYPNMRGIKVDSRTGSYGGVFSEEENRIGLNMKEYLEIDEKLKRARKDREKWDNPTEVMLSNAEAFDMSVDEAKANLDDKILNLETRMMAEQHYLQEVLNHEIQHAIQRTEGFAQGGNKERIRQLLKDHIDVNEQDYEYAKKRIDIHKENMDILFDLKRAKELFKYPKRFLKMMEHYKYSGSYDDIVKKGQELSVDNYFAAMDNLENTAWHFGVNPKDYGFDTEDYQRLVDMWYKRGATAEDIAKKGMYIDEAIKVWEAICKKSKNDSDEVMDDVDEYDRILKMLRKQTDHELYERLAGEVEARNAAYRMDWTEEQRRNSLAEDTERSYNREKIDRKDQIIRRWSNVSMGSDDEGKARIETEGSEAEQPEAAAGARDRAGRWVVGRNGKMEWKSGEVLAEEQEEADRKAEEQSAIAKRRAGRRDSSLGGRYRRMVNEGAKDWKEFVMTEVAGGMKFRPDDTEAGTQGLLAHTTGNRKDVKAFLDKKGEGLTPEEAAEKIWGDMPVEMQEQCTDQDVFNEILDLVMSYKNHSQMMGDVERSHMMSDVEGMSDYEKEQADEYARNLGFDSWDEYTSQQGYLEAEGERIKKEARDRYLRRIGYDGEEDYQRQMANLDRQARKAAMKERERQAREELIAAISAAEVRPEIPERRRGEDLLDYAERVAMADRARAEYDRRHPVETLTREQAMDVLRNNIVDALQRDSVTQMDKRTLNSILKTLSRTDAVNLPEKLDEALKLVRHIQDKANQRDIDRMLKMKVSDVNGKNMSIAKNVDDRTRRLMEDLNGRVLEVQATGLEDKIHALRSENWHLREERRGVLEDPEAIADIDAKIEANNEEIANLTEQRRKLVEEKSMRGDVNVDNAIDALKQKMDDAAAEGKPVSEDDVIQMTALQLHKIAIDNAAKDGEIMKLEDQLREAKKAKGELWEAYKDRLQAAKDAVDAEPRYENVEAWKELSREYVKKRDRLNLQINGLNKLISEATAQKIAGQEAFREAIGRELAGGKDSLLQKIMGMQKRRSEMIMNAMHDITGGNTERVKVRDTEDPNMQSEKWYKKIFTSALSSFEYMAQAINERTLGKDGWFYRQFVSGEEGVIEANNGYIRSMKSARERLDEKVKEIFEPRTAEAKRGRRIETFADWWKEMDKEPKVGKWGKENGIRNSDGEWATTGIEVIDMESLDEDGAPTGERVEITNMSKGQATYAYMLWKMADGRAKLEMMGFDDASMEQVRDYIGAENVKMADWVQGEFFAEEREKVNERYLEMYNTSMAAIENYVPIKINSGSIREEVDLSGDSGAGAGKLVVKTGALVNRKANVNPVDLSWSAANVIWDHLDEVEDFYNFAPVRRDLGWILSSQAFRNQLNKNSHGAFKRLVKAAEVATHADQSSSKAGQGELDKVLATIQKGLVGGNIAFRNNTALKQMLSVPAFLGYSQDPRFLGAFVKNVFKIYGGNSVGLVANMATFGTLGKRMFTDREKMKGAMKGALTEDIKWCLDNVPDFWDRVLKGTAGDNRLDEKSVNSAIGRFVDGYMEVGMRANQMVDALTCAIGIKTIYEYKMARAKERAEKMNITGGEKAKYLEEQHRQAIMEATIYYNGTQQSNHKAFLSPMQVGKSFVDRANSLYQNASIGYARKFVTSVQDMHRLVRNWDKMVGSYSHRILEEQGINWKEAEPEQLRQAEAEARSYMANAARKKMFDAMLYGFFLNYIWDMGGRGLLGLFQNDDDEEKGVLGVMGQAITYPARGTTGMNILGTIATGGKMALGLSTDEVNQFLEDYKKAEEQFGAVSPEVAYVVSKRASRFMGVNPDTWINTYMGTERMIRDGVTDRRKQDMIIDLMFLLNSPESQRAAVAKKLYSDRYGDDWENHVEEYVHDVERAMKYKVEEDQWEDWLPNIKALKKATEDKLRKEFIQKNLTPEEKEALKKAEEFDKWLKNTDSLTELEKRFEKEDNARRREKIMAKFMKEDAKQHDSGAEVAKSLKETLLGNDESSKQDWEQAWIRRMDKEELQYESTIKRGLKENKRVWDEWRKIAKEDEGKAGEFEKEHEYEIEHYRAMRDAVNEIRDLKKDWYEAEQAGDADEAARIAKQIRKRLTIVKMM